MHDLYNYLIITLSVLNSGNFSQVQIFAKILFVLIFVSDFTCL